MTQEHNITVRVLILHEGHSYVAQCLEYDIAAQGKTLPEVKQAIERTIVGQVILDLQQGKQPLQGINQAPRIYWQKFEQALRLEDEEPLNIPAPFVINEIQKELRVI